MDERSRGGNPTRHFLLIRRVTADKVLEGLRGEGGTVMRTSLDHTKESALQAALAGVQATVPAATAVAEHRADMPSDAGTR